MNLDNSQLEENNSNKLLVTFGGIKQGMGMPVYEFYNSLKDLKCDKLYLKDLEQVWYHKGINHDVNSILKLKEFLSDLINRKQYENVVFIGNSMGGYGAILFGVLLNVNSVIAFSPQTFIGRAMRFWNKDHRWANEISKTYTINRKQKSFYNIKLLLKRVTYSTQIDVYYSTNDKLDKIHAEKLKGQTNINLFPYDKGNHNLIKHLRDEDNLFNIIFKRIDEF